MPQWQRFKLSDYISDDETNSAPFSVYFNISFEKLGLNCILSSTSGYTDSIESTDEGAEITYIDKNRITIIFSWSYKQSMTYYKRILSIGI